MKLYAKIWPEFSKKCHILVGYSGNNTIKLGKIPTRSGNITILIFSGLTTFFK